MFFTLVTGYQTVLNGGIPGVTCRGQRRSKHVSLWALYLLLPRVPHLSVIASVFSQLLSVSVRCSDSLSACWQQFSDELLIVWCPLPLLSPHTQDAIICAKFIWWGLKYSSERLDFTGPSYRVILLSPLYSFIYHAKISKMEEFITWLFWSS